MTKCFTKFFWRKFWRFWVRYWFSRFFALKVFSKFFSGDREHGVYGGSWAFFCSGCPSLGFPLEFRYISVLPPMILRYFFDHSSIAERRMNGERTELERSLNGARTEDERSLNGARTELERSSNGAWTELERSSNGGWTENDWKPNGERTEELTLLAKRSVFLRYDIGMPSELSSAKMERVLASLWVQNYKAKKRNPNFLQICGVSKTQNDENTGLISRVFKIHNIFLHDFIEFRRR